MRPLPFLLAGLLLAACASPSGPTLSSAAVAPTSPPAQCQPTVKAPSKAEPAPPAGLTKEGFYNPLLDFVLTKLGDEKGNAWWEWFSTTHPRWAREGWTRIDEARTRPPCAS